MSKRPGVLGKYLSRNDGLILLVILQYEDTSLMGLGYGPDSVPKGNPVMPKSNQLKRHTHLVQGKKWELRGPFICQQFGTQNIENTMLPSSLGLR